MSGLFTWLYDNRLGRWLRQSYWLYAVSVTLAILILKTDDLLFPFGTVALFLGALLRLVMVIFSGYLLVFCHRPWQHLKSPIKGLPGSDLRWLLTIFTSVFAVLFIAYISAYITRLTALTYQWPPTITTLKQTFSYVFTFSLSFSSAKPGTEAVFGNTDALVAALVGAATIAALLIQYTQDVATLNRFAEATGFFRTLEEALTYFKEERPHQVDSTFNEQPRWDMLYMGVTPFPLHVSEPDWSDRFIDTLCALVKDGVLNRITFVVRDEDPGNEKGIGGILSVEDYLTKWESQVGAWKEEDHYPEKNIHTPLRYYWDMVQYLPDLNKQDAINVCRERFEGGMRLLRQLTNKVDLNRKQQESDLETADALGRSAAKPIKPEFRFCASPHVTESYVFVFRSEAVFGFMEHYPILPLSTVRERERRKYRPSTILGYKTTDRDIVGSLRRRIEAYFPPSRAVETKRRESGKGQAQKPAPTGPQPDE